MKIFNKKSLQIKPLNERINGFTVSKNQIQLKEDFSTPSSEDGTGNISASDVVKASEGEDAGDSVRTDGSTLDGNSADNRPTIAADGCRTNPNDPKSPLSQTKVNNKINSLKHDANVQKMGGLGKVNIDFNSKTPRPTLESVNKLKNNSVAFSKGELNKILLNR